MRRLDVSMPLTPGMPAFPGDPVFASRRVRSIEQGEPYNLSLLEFGSHCGTHVDPPLHFVPEGAGTDALDLSTLNGPCYVLKVPAPVQRIGPAELAAVPPGTERLLLRTSNSARWADKLAFFPDYVALNLAGARRLRELGVRLVGLDALSIEVDAQGTFPVHHELLGHGVLIVEGLLLGDAPPGAAQLVCLPLRLARGDGGPARVLLEYP